MTARTNRRHTAIIFAAVALSLTASFLTLRTIDAATAERLIAENGPVEMLSAAGYFACAMLMFAKFGVQPMLRKHWYMPALLLLMGLRELDFHKRFTEMGIFKSNFYFSSEVPLVQKISALLVIMLAATAVMLLTRNHLRSMLHRLRRLNVAAVSFATAATFAVLSKGMDGLERKLAKIDVTLSPQAARDGSLLEELLELGIPAMLMVAVIATSVRTAYAIQFSATTTEQPRRRAA